MKVFEIIILILICSTISCSVFLWYRNEEVYKIRLRILNQEPVTRGLELHDCLPDYDAMLYNFSKPLTYAYWLSYAEEQLKIKNK